MREKIKHPNMRTYILTTTTQRLQRRALLQSSENHQNSVKVYICIVWWLTTVSRGAKTKTTPNFSPSKHENIRKKAVLAEKSTNMKAQQNKPLMPVNSPFSLAKTKTACYLGLDVIRSWFIINMVFEPLHQCRELHSTHGIARNHFAGIFLLPIIAFVLVIPAYLTKSLNKIMQRLPRAVTFPP